MLSEKINQRHVFYHADRAASLQEYQEIKLDTDGLSYFGKAYWSVIQSKNIEEMNSAQKREFYLEQIKNEPRYSLYASRMQCIFGANSINEAIIFAESIAPRPNNPIPIIEVFAERFWTLDTNWLDYDNNQMQLDYYRNYWDAIISNHCPQVGQRRPPRLEVLMALPITTGKIVHIVPGQP
ncbi:MAG: hypothetical protein JNN00_13645 [Chitinophagaceae bacterium]|nr:hypothetical protein [Chitinophagaceae bacterium]